MGVRDSWIEKREAAAAASNGNDHGTHGSQGRNRSEEHTSELQSQSNLVCRLLLEKKKHHDKCRAGRDPGRDRSISCGGDVARPNARYVLIECGTRKRRCELSRAFGLGRCEASPGR